MRRLSADKITVEMSEETSGFARIGRLRRRSLRKKKHWRGRATPRLASAALNITLQCVGRRVKDSLEARSTNIKVNVDMLALQYQVSGFTISSSSNTNSKVSQFQ